ncbi:MAG: hypothetical protein WDN10_03525 [bacterium]
MTKTVLVTYRSNDVFEAYVPRILETLKIAGYEVREKSYPRGFQGIFRDRDNMETEAKEASYWLPDLTCKSDLFLSAKQFRFGGLDQLIARGISASLFGEKSTHDIGLEETKAIFQKVARMVADKIGEPKVVSLWTSHFGDHEPFRGNPELGCESLRAWLGELFPQCTVEILDCYRPTKGWNILDRHDPEAHPCYYAKSGRLFFSIPVETMVRDLERVGLLTGVVEEAWPHIARELESELLEINGAG